MVFIIKNRIKGFKVCQIWFADKPVDVNGFDRVMYYWPKSKPDDKSFRENCKLSAYGKTWNIRLKIYSKDSTTPQDMRCAKRKKRQ
jgi:hypothetical protein